MTSRTSILFALVVLGLGMALLFSPPGTAPRPRVYTPIVAHVNWGSQADWAPFFPTTTTTVVVETSTVAVPETQPVVNHEAESPPLGGRSAGGSVWACIRNAESGNDYGDAGGGAYQFESETWHSLGYSGSAQDYPPSVQDAAAMALQGRDGWSQWTTAGRCGVG